MATVAILINHPNLDILMMPVIDELHRRGVQTQVLVAECGLTDRLDAAGVVYSRDLAVIDRFLAAEGPRLFLNGADLVPVHAMGIRIDQQCAARGIPTLTLEHAPFAVDWDQPFPEDWKFAADVMAAVGTEDIRHYLEIGVSPERLVLTGLPQHDLLANVRRRRLSDPPAAGVTIFGRNHSFAGPRSAEGIAPAQWSEVMRDLIVTIAAVFPEDPLRIKPHPAEPFHGTDAYYRNAVPTDLQDRLTVLSARQTNEELFLASRCVVTFSPSVMLEATLAGVPAVIFDHTGRSEEWRADMASAGVIVAKATLDDFASGFVAVVHDVADRLQHDVSLPDDFVAKYAHRRDGQSAARVCDLIGKMMGAGKRVQAPSSQSISTQRV